MVDKAFGAILLVAALILLLAALRSCRGGIETAEQHLGQDATAAWQAPDAAAETPSAAALFERSA